MNYLFELSHPKHYYQFRIVMRELLKDASNNVMIIARDKDVLINILEEEKISFTVYGGHGKSIISKFFLVPNLLYNYYKIIRNNQIDVVISKASPYAAILSKIVRIKTIITPDSEVVRITKWFVAPSSHSIITTQNFGIEFGKRQQRLNGLFEDCYLHPSVFQPNIEIVKQLGFSIDKPFFILRFVSWNANHDINNYGFNSEEKIILVNKLKNRGSVYITCEEESLPKELRHHMIKIPASEIHHVLHFAALYVGDSQTMATESALLGTPALRYNSFVGNNDMSNFIILEKKYRLLLNFNKFSDLLTCIDEIDTNMSLKKEWMEKRKKYYEEVGDINSDLLELIINI